MNKIQSLILFIIISSILSSNMAIAQTLLLNSEIDTPIEALLAYFPPPSVMRCLNHSSIPRKIRKAYIYRKSFISNKIIAEEKINFEVQPKGLLGRRFITTGTITRNDETVPLTIDGDACFKINKDGNMKTIGLLGKLNKYNIIAEIYGSKRMERIKGTIGNQEIDYTTIFRNSWGKIGNTDFNLKLIGEDKKINGEWIYFLTGSGKLGEHSITVSGKQIKEDCYEISEWYGPLQVSTYIKVFD